jgi:hypothetical protein
LLTDTRTEARLSHWLVKISTASDSERSLLKKPPSLPLAVLIAY